jgi:hypothetical protein
VTERAVQKSMRNGQPSMRGNALMPPMPPLPSVREHEKKRPYIAA